MLLCINSRSYFLCRMIIIFASQNEFAPKARRVHRGGLRAALHGGSAFAPVHARSLSGAISTFRAMCEVLPAIKEIVQPLSPPKR
jgi:hypothetical protein